MHLPAGFSSRRGICWKHTILRTVPRIEGKSAVPPDSNVAFGEQWRLAVSRDRGCKVYESACGAVESHVPPWQGCWMTNKHRTFVSSPLALRPGDRIQHCKLVKQSCSDDRYCREVY